MAWYIDTSAVVKLVTVEAETPAIHEWVAEHHPEFVASDLLRTELQRAVAKVGGVPPIEVEEALATIDYLPATTAVFDAAARLAPVGLRTLDAVHLATALGIADDCDGLITYDDRLADAARAHGFHVIAPTHEETAR